MDMEEEDELNFKPLINKMSRMVMEAKAEVNQITVVPFAVPIVTGISSSQQPTTLSLFTSDPVSNAGISKNSSTGTVITSDKNCVVCGLTLKKRDEESKFKLDISAKERQIRGNTLCKVMEISEAQFSDFINQNEFCSSCDSRISQVVEDFVLLESIEQEIARKRFKIELLMRANSKRITTKLKLSRTNEKLLTTSTSSKHIDGQWGQTQSYEEMIQLMVEEICKPVSRKSVPEISTCGSNLKRKNAKSTHSRRKISKIDTLRGACFSGSTSIEIERGLAAVKIENNSDDVDLYPTEEDGDPLMDFSRLDNVNSCYYQGEIDNDNWEENNNATDDDDQSDPDYSPNIKLDKHKCSKKREIEGIAKVRLRTEKKVRSNEPKPPGVLVSCQFPDCTAVFNSTKQIQLNAHFRKVHEGKEDCFVCTHGSCTKSYVCLKRLRRHVNLKHSKEGPTLFKCLQCSDVFTDNSSLRIHKKLNHKPREEELIFACSSCPKRFGNIKLFDRHMKSHSRPFMCEICSKTFSASQYLLYHKTRHHPQESQPHPYKCEECGKSLSNPTNLHNHIKKIHRGEFTHQCEICGAGCMSGGELRKHMLFHTNVRDYKCEECGAAFRTRTTLNIHSRSHTGERPYVCKICGKGFMESNKLKRHEHSHSNDQKHSCHICGKTFPVRNYLCNHLRRHKENSEMKPRDRRRINALVEVGTQSHSQPESEPHSSSTFVNVNCVPSFPNPFPWHI